MTLPGHRCKYTGKVRFTSRREAQAAATIRGMEHGVLLRTYRCPKCRGIHLTHQARVTDKQAMQEHLDEQKDGEDTA